jgi:nucleotide-binding universal stress UspA family protein
MVVNDSCTAPCRLSGKPVESIRGARRRRELHAHFDASNGRRAAMIKDVMVPVDGTAADEERLAAASQIAEVFNSQIIGLFLNVLPVMIVPEDGIGAPQAAELLQKAREAADRMEPRLIERLARLQRPMQLRRFDILEDAVGKVAAREARTADTFVALRPNGASGQPEDLVEGILFGSGRHIFLVKRAKAMFNRILVAWNGTRESARALAEAMPYLHKAQEATVVVVDDEPPAEGRAALGKDAASSSPARSLKAYPRTAVLPSPASTMDLQFIPAGRARRTSIIYGSPGHRRRGRRRCSA